MRTAVLSLVVTVTVLWATSLMAAEFRLAAPCPLAPAAGTRALAPSQPTECLFAGDRLRAALFPIDAEQAQPRVIVFEWDEANGRPRATRALTLSSLSVAEGRAPAFGRLSAKTWAWVRSAIGADTPESVPAKVAKPSVAETSRGQEAPALTQVAVRYQHDFMGRVVMKIGNDGIRQYLYEPGSTRIRAEYDENNNLVARYEWGSDRIISVERPLEGRRLYYAYDGLGSVVALTDDSGAVVARYNYDAWGALREPQAPDDPNRVTFTGHRFEPETGLYNANARMYDPATGRFITMDTVPVNPADPATLNRYAYARGNPTRFVDPTGNYEEDVHNHLTRFLAEKAGFSSTRAQEIGKQTGELDFDARDAMHGPIFGKGPNLDAMEKYHFVSPNRLAELKQAAFEKKDSRSVGEYLHALEDTYSHQSNPRGRDFSATYRDALILGHAFHGHWTDQTWQRPELAMKMAKETYQELVELRKAISGDDAAAPTFESFNEKVADFVTTKPELYPQTIATETVLDVMDYTAKIQKLDASYVPLPRETDARRESFDSYRLQEYARRLAAKSPAVTIMEGRDGSMVRVPQGYGSEEAFMAQVREQVKALERKDLSIPQRDARARAAREYERLHPVQPKETCGSCSAQ